MKMLFWLVMTLAFTYAVLCLLIYTQQERLLFYPTQLPATFRYSFTQPFTETMLPVEGAMLNVVHFPQPKAKGVILYLHGNADLIRYLEPVATFFGELGYAVIIPDYRGYGKSTGQITSEAELHADLAAVYRYVQEHYPESQITLYGQSLGSGLAAKLAAQHQPARLILESPYASMRAMAAHHLPWVPRALLKYPLRTDQWLAQVTCPVYLIHGTADRVIPYAASEQLYPLIRSEKALLTVPEGGHHGLLYKEQVRQFLAELLLGSPFGSIHRPAYPLVAQKL
ncbi:MAG: alpha/beta fold hydrolase [Caldilineaceae bacterium]|nr:alpha/beta fold hydrolase [Caldilineaceae bacterium]